LFGEFRMSSAVFSVTAAASASRSSANVSARHGTTRTLPPAASA